MFIRNNIRFRSAAAKSLEGFFNSKAFYLNEVIGSKVQFTDTAREVLLLLFNSNTQVLFDIELMLLDKEVVSTEIATSVTNMILSRHNMIGGMFDKHSDVFDSNFIRHWMHIHRQLIHYILNIGIIGKSPIVAYPIIVESFVSYLAATMFELFELDCLLGSDLVKRKVGNNQTSPESVILYMDDVTRKYTEATGKSAELERLTYYVNTLFKDNMEEYSVTLKDYSKQKDGYTQMLKADLIKSMQATFTKNVITL